MNINFLPVDLLKLLKDSSAKTDEELCGFIHLNNDKTWHFNKCDNLHPNKKTNFLISPRDYINNKDSILFHSHPFESDLIGFSDVDIESQTYHCLDMLLYSVKNNTFDYKKYGYD